ncbi:vegetative cell wall protein gp1-like [Colias croceus]|uniref:vegetative cell wall protein gp1-like n=1 Tax=Colias crocea TaxID=72248 RepID=UPI001E27ACEF|nr:vegetative cell wall protein gp1-like [Colias croceus]
MIGTKLLLALLPLLAFGNAQNTGWSYSSPFARFPPRYIPRPVYHPPTIVQTTLPPTVTQPATPRIEITKQPQPRDSYPSTRSPLIPSSFEPAERLPTFFRPRPYTQSPPEYSTASPAQKPTIIVLPGDHSLPNTPKPSFTIVYPSNYKNPGDELAKESSIEQPSPSSEPQPQPGYQPQESEPASPSQPALILDQNQTEPEPAQPSPQPEPEFVPRKIQPSPASHQIDMEPAQSSYQPKPDVVEPPQIQASSQPSFEVQPEAVPQQALPSPQPEPEVVAPQVPSSPGPVQEDVAPKVPSSPKPEPEIVAPQVPLSPQPEPAAASPQFPPPPQPEPEAVASQFLLSPQLEPKDEAPQVEPSPQPVPKAVLPQIQQAQPVHLSSSTDVRPRYLPVSSWSKPSWPQYTKPSTIPNHPYPWMPTTKPIPLPSRTIATPKPSGIIVIPTIVPVPKRPVNSGQLTELMDYQCAKPNGYFSVPNQCDAFIECKANTAMQVECPDGLHFNPNAVWPEYPCDYPSRVNCGANLAKQVPEPTADCPRQYGYFPSPSGDCGKYIMCQVGKATEMTCPAGLAFNSVTAICDWPANVPSCNPDVFQGFTCPAPDMDENGKPTDLISKFRQGKSCKRYIACQQGKPRLLSCDDGFSYDDATQSCIDSDLVTDCT